jgi:hypothetical protein
VEDGVANARALAAGVKRGVTDTLRIDGQPQVSYEGGLRSNVQVAAPAEGGTTFVAGDVQITCNVTVTCAF